MNYSLIRIYIFVLLIISSVVVEANSNPCLYLINKLFGKKTSIIRTVKFDDGLEVPSFVSVKPLSHERYPPVEDDYPFLQVYLHPHIRGAVLECTDRFLFWYPFRFGMEPQYYQNFQAKLKHRLK